MDHLELSWNICTCFLGSCCVQCLQAVSIALPSRRPRGQGGGRTCGRCRWWRRCRRRWCRVFPSTMAAAARGPFSCESRHPLRFLLSCSRRCHACSACCRGSSSRCLQGAKEEISEGGSAFLAVFSSPCPQYQVLTIWILEDGQRSIAVLIMGKLVVIQTLVEFVRADQGRCPRRGICVKDEMSKSFDLSRESHQMSQHGSQRIVEH